eukprot:4211666-Prymnesium_polylepis.1
MAAHSTWGSVFAHRPVPRGSIRGYHRCTSSFAKWHSRNPTRPASRAHLLRRKFAPQSDD